MSLPLPAHPVPQLLPMPVTALLGRDHELAQVCAILRAPMVHLLTLCGPGGIGKTRLAIQAAHMLAADFVDGVIYTPLAAITDPQLVASAIMGALGVREADNQSVPCQVLAKLRSLHALLLLDNFEQVTEAAPFVGQLIAQCPQLKVIVTSRAVLNLVGERRYLVPPLALPQATANVETLSGSAAVALLIERARAVRPDMQLTAENAATIVEICQKLEGLPLAIELAAARLSLLSLHTLRERLSSRLNLLTNGPRDLPAHQQTLRKTIAWSYDLLTAEEQRVFQLLGVCAGSWTIEAAEALVRGEPGDMPNLLDLLASLLEQSMIVRAEGAAGISRFAMLETLREFALEQLQAAGEMYQARQRHAMFFVQFCEQAESKLIGPAQREWLEQLEDEHDNIRAALQSAAEQRDAATIARISSAIWRFWHVHGHVAEGRGWLAQAGSLAANLPPSLRARVWMSAGWLANVQADLPAAEAHFAGALADAQYAGDDDVIGQALGGLGRMAHLHGDVERASKLYASSIELLRTKNGNLEVAWTLTRLGILALECADHTSAYAQFCESRDMFDALGFDWGRTWAQTYLGDTARAANQSAQASQLYTEAVRMFNQLGDRESAEDVRLRLEAVHTQPLTLPQLAAAPDSLTPREIEVLRLVANDMTDQQVAATLVVSTRTVHAHLRSVYGKLGVSTRSAMTRLAVEQGLV